LFFCAAVVEGFTTGFFAVAGDFTVVFWAVDGVFAIGFGFDFAGVLLFTVVAEVVFFGVDFLGGAGVVFEIGAVGRKSLLLLPKSWLKTPTAESAKQTNKIVILQLLNIKIPKYKLLI
jgi:hypothetical protein